MFVSTEIITKNLLIYFDPANDKSLTNEKTIIIDISRNQNDGKITNFPTYRSENLGSFLFDGMDDFIQLETDIDLTNRFTIIAFIRPSNNNNKDSCIFCSTANSNQNWFGIRNNRLCLFSTQFSDINNFEVIGPELIPNNWYQIVATVNFREVRLYVNGVRQKVVDKNFEIGHWIGSCTIGKYGTANDKFYSGEIASLQVYNKVLYNEDIQTIFEAFRTRFSI